MFLIKVNANINFAYADIPRNAAGVTYIGGDNSAVGGGNYKTQYVVFFNNTFYIFVVQRVCS